MTREALCARVEELVQELVTHRLATPEASRAFLAREFASSVTCLIESELALPEASRMSLSLDQRGEIVCRARLAGHLAPNQENPCP